MLSPPHQVKPHRPSITSIKGTYTREWACPACTLLNPEHTLACTACDGPKFAAGRGHRGHAGLQPSSEAPVHVAAPASSGRLGLTGEQVAFFRKYGFLVLKQVVPTETIGDAKRKADQLIQEDVAHRKRECRQGVSFKSGCVLGCVQSCNQRCARPVFAQPLASSRALSRAPASPRTTSANRVV